ncbi:hypothetical protein HDV01_006255 [Terramyces sp. JEL0728]|nr:hypothetical protein HDV01_006255 [Terramyces sp. JEL0728]
MALASFLDYGLLGFSSFYLGHVLDEPRQRPEMLWLYFTSPSMRSILYTTWAISMTGDWLFNGSAMKPTKAFVIGLFAYAGYLHFPSRERKGDISWRTSATTKDLGFLGSWWIGGGDGEWFCFLGHNGADEKTILPAALLEQMSVKRNKVDEDDGVIVMEEVDEED